MCFGFGDYFMAAALAAASYSRIGFSLYFAVRARRLRVPGGSKFHLEPGTIQLTMAHMFQDQMINQVQRVSTMYHAMQEWL